MLLRLFLYHLGLAPNFTVSNGVLLIITDFKILGQLLVKPDIFKMFEISQKYCMTEKIFQQEMFLLIRAYEFPHKP